ncbi:MAG: MBL fold metallo-hydrolase [Rhodospirillales bacterium]|jgi:glyoxylase-like metal-dependent hydrolase (beta-lactamase superfamily II)|nr:MBL fold metallo-hydrolase [Rhodospirillales bacterium]MBT4039834.1 MBL fold metallo-hydrolase [Rhodospirillales bacterium]MBT4625980.1 MBL fold metallo-hydrolase [Rhodospirillales bacterium]MBT5350594.1 MBL fold metallo-hydrolase [Rhodospirillales bacterium]MBT5520322.1 MBL fold metallo-hydrolase [Rhodospirillales bacterium]
MNSVTAEEWYEVRHIDDDVSFIAEPFIKDFYRCNIWHVRGSKRDMLVDTGMGVVSLRTHIPLVTEKSCIAVASHVHFDHIGCHHEFAERYVHADEADILAEPTRAATLADLYVTDDIFTKMPPSPYSSTKYEVQSAPATRILQGGDVIDLGNRQFEVIHTPGHSPGGIMLFEKTTEILFSGDTVYDGPLIDDAYHSDIPTYIEVMKRIMELPVRVVHGGHFPSFDGEKYRALIRLYLKEKDK